MDQTDARQVVLFLCWRAGVKPCRVDWSRRHVRGCYRPDQGAIKVGPSDRGAAVKGLDRVLHEVAHHVVAIRRHQDSVIPKQRAARLRFLRKYPGMRPVTWSDGKRWGRVWHGPVFVETLRELAGFWYGDPAAYPWEDEYASIRAAGKSGR